MGNVGTWHDLVVHRPKAKPSLGDSHRIVPCAYRVLVGTTRTPGWLSRPAPQGRNDDGRQHHWQAPHDQRRDS